MEGNSQAENMIGIGTEGEGIILGEGNRGPTGSLDFRRASSGTLYLPITSYDRVGFKGDGSNKFSVYLRIGQTADWLAHEFGHAIYLSNNLLYYYNWIQSNPSNSQYGGHGSGDPNGQFAIDVQNLYKKGGYK